MSVVIIPHRSLRKFLILRKLSRAQTVEAGGLGALPGQPDPLHGAAVGGLQSAGPAVLGQPASHERLHAEGLDVQMEVKVLPVLPGLCLLGCVGLRLRTSCFINFLF